MTEHDYHLTKEKTVSLRWFKCRHCDKRVGIDMSWPNDNAAVIEKLNNKPTDSSTRYYGDVQ